MATRSPPAPDKIFGNSSSSGVTFTLPLQFKLCVVLPRFVLERQIYQSCQEPLQAKVTAPPLVA